MGVTRREVGRQEGGTLALDDGRGPLKEGRLGEEDSQARPTLERRQGRGPQIRVKGQERNEGRGGLRPRSGGSPHEAIR